MEERVNSGIEKYRKGDADIVVKNSDGLYGRYDKTDFCLYFKNCYRYVK